MKIIIIVGVVIILFLLIITSKNRRKPREKLKIEPNENWQPKEIFYKKKLLNKEEILVFNSLLKNIIEYEIFPQVSIGEIIGNNNRSDYSRINQKRADFCIVDKNYMPVAVIEYHGSGHNKGNYQKRDNTKRIAVENAGLIYHAILEKDLNNIENHIKERLIPKLQVK